MWIIPKNLFAAVAVVHVKIQNSHSLQLISMDGVSYTHRYIVKHAEAHGTIGFRMMSGRANSAKSIIDFA